MRRVSEKSVKRDFIRFSVLAFILIILGVAIPLIIWFVPLAPYEAYEEKSVVIESFYTKTTYSFSRYGSSHRSYRIKTTDGETYVLTGRFDYDKLYESLKPGVVAKIKWADNFLNPGAEPCEELSIGGKILMEYDDEPAPILAPLILGLLFILMGAIIFIWARWHKNHIEEIERKRNLRIAKKYCKNKSALENFENKQKEKKS